MIVHLDQTRCTIDDENYQQLIKLSPLEYTSLLQEILTESQYIRNLHYDGKYILSKKRAAILLNKIKEQKSKTS